MNVDVSTITFESGTFRSSASNEIIDIAGLATAGFRVHKVPEALRGGLDASAVYAPREPTYPNGCHICEVEIDPDTGVVEIVRYTVADDVGTVLDHASVEGQIRGGVAQGIGQALMEEIRYEPASGQLLSGSFLDYAMPRAAQVPAIAVTSLEVRSTTQPMGVKGAGEAGVVGALPAVISAIADALRLPHIDMPATPQRIWEALNRARSTGALTSPAR
jgi:carbon-monoxide dehydrogenase large subunit